MGAATRPPRGKLRALSRAVRGKGDPRASSSWRGPLGPCPGGRRRPVSLGPGASRRERPFRPRVLDPRAPALRVPTPPPPGTPATGTQPCGPLRRCHPCKWAPRAVWWPCVRRGPRRLGWAGLGGHCQACLAVPSSRSRATPLRFCGKPRDVGVLPALPPGRRGGGVPAPASERRGFFGAGQAETPWTGSSAPRFSGRRAAASLRDRVPGRRGGGALSWRRKLSLSWVGLSGAGTAGCVL